MGAQTNQVYDRGPLQGLPNRGRPSDARLRAQRTRSAMNGIEGVITIGVDPGADTDMAVMAEKLPGGGWKIHHFGTYCPDAEAADHDELMKPLVDRAPSPIAWQSRREPRGTGARIMVLTAIACAVLLACWWLS